MLLLAAVLLGWSKRWRRSSWAGRGAELRWPDSLVQCRHTKSSLFLLGPKPPASGYCFTAKLWRVSSQRCTEVPVLPVLFPCVCLHPFFHPGAGSLIQPTDSMCSLLNLERGAGREARCGAALGAWGFPGLWQENRRGQQRCWPGGFRCLAVPGGERGGFQYSVAALCGFLPPGFERSVHPFCSIRWTSVFYKLWLLLFGGMSSCAFGSHFNKDYWGPSLGVGKVASCQFEAAVPLPLFLLLRFPQVFSSQLYSPSLPRAQERSTPTCFELSLSLFLPLPTQTPRLFCIAYFSNILFFSFI